MIYMFPTGLKVEGTFDEVLSVANAMGFKIEGDFPAPTGYYRSETKGLVKISEMDSIHLRNSLKKLARDYYSTKTSNDMTNAEFLEFFAKMAEDAKICELWQELYNRKG